MGDADIAAAVAIGHNADRVCTINIPNVSIATIKRSVNNAHVRTM